MHLTLCYYYKNLGHLAYVEVKILAIKNFAVDLSVLTNFVNINQIFSSNKESSH